MAPVTSLFRQQFITSRITDLFEITDQLRQINYNARFTFKHLFRNIFARAKYKSNYRELFHYQGRDL